jgi:hypothetical protein|uniref:Uncharacterized protein n=1 Tax=viral metagenome TaxID=1070528 RepID=A0A6C0IS32_9ZZZZ
MDASAFANQAGTAVASAGTSLSNAAMKTMTKIAESRSRKVSQQLLKSHCEELNKEMVNSVDKIVDKLNINDQSEIFEKVADNYFDNDLTEMLKNEITSSLTNSVRKNLRNQLYDHYKKDFKVEQDALEKQEGIEGGGMYDKAKNMVLKKLFGKAISQLDPMIAGIVTQNQQVLKHIDGLKGQLDSNPEIAQTLIDELNAGKIGDKLSKLHPEITKLTTALPENIQGPLLGNIRAGIPDIVCDATKIEGGGGGPDEISTKVAAAGAGDDNDSVDVDTETSSNSTSSSGDEAAMMNELVTKVNQQILMDDDLIDDFKKGIVENIASGSFKNALQREVINRLEPMIEKTMESKLNEIFEDMDFKETAMEVIKGQQRLYDSRTKRKTQGGKKNIINKKDKSNKRRTRRHRKKST